MKSPVQTMHFHKDRLKTMHFHMDGHSMPGTTRGLLQPEERVPRSNCTAQLHKDGLILDAPLSHARAVRSAGAQTAARVRAKFAIQTRGTAPGMLVLPCARDTYHYPDPDYHVSKSCLQCSIVPQVSIVRVCVCVLLRQGKQDKENNCPSM